MKVLGDDWKQGMSAHHDRDRDRFVIDAMDKLRVNSRVSKRKRK